jgi:hypothetical protein
MRRSFTVFLIVLFSFAAIVMAKDKKFRKQVNQVPVSKKAVLVVPQEEPASASYAEDNNAVVPVSNNNVQRIRKTAATHHVQVDASLNGYGWLNPLIRSIDRFKGITVAGDDVDFLLTAYRQKIEGNTATGILGATEIDVSNGLANCTLYREEELNVGMGGVGARYPGVVALDLPLVAFNHYVEQRPTGLPGGDVANISHPYLFTDYEETYGVSGGGDWTTPYCQMDDGYLHHNVDENRLWNGSVAVVKDDVDDYHYIGVYSNWYSNAEWNLHGYQNDHVILNAITADPTGDTDSWDIDTDPALIDVNDVSFGRIGVALNSSGFGVIAGPGHLGWHHPDSGWYYTKLKITYQTTDDYGESWSIPDTVSFGDLGFPLYHDPAQGDSLLGWWEVPTPGDTVWVWYTGPTFMGTNFDMDVIVDDNNYIYVGFNSLWGRPTEGGWYPSPYYSGVFMARKRPGYDWEAARIAYNNGVFEGDDFIEGMSQYFFDTEVDLALDENGSIYAAWLDRRRTGVHIGELNRYADPEQSGRIEDFKTDIYASRSPDGGANWSASPTNISDTENLDEYELNLALHADSRDNGTVWVAYYLCDDPASGSSATDAYIDLENQVWVAEANDFEVPSAIDDDGKEIVVKDYSLNQNYPNPFNPTTRIKFIPLKSGQANLTVYSVTGEKVAELYTGYAKQGAEYTFDFDGSRIAAGVYFYRLTIGNSVEVKKMVLIK